MLIVKRLEEVKYNKWNKPEKREEYEIDVIFEDAITRREEIVRLPYGVLQELYESVKEEKK